MSKPKPPLPWKTTKSKKAKRTEGALPLLSDVLPDDPLSALTRMAYPLAVERNPLADTFETPIYDRKRKSRFFFRIDPTVMQHVELLKAQQMKSKIDPSEPINQHIEDRAKTFNRDVADGVDERLVKVREYFLTDLAPRVMAAQGGMAQAREVVKVALNTDVEQASMDQFDAMLRHGVQIKMARFIAKYLDLTVKDAEVLLAKMGAGKRGGANSELMAVVQQAMNPPVEHPAGNHAMSRADRNREAGRAEMKRTRNGGQEE